MPFRCRLSMHPISAICLAGAAMLLSPDNAEATCGSYVMIGGERTIHKEPPSDPLPPTCHGPGCSRVPAMPPTPVSIPATSLSQPQELSAQFDHEIRSAHRSGWPFSSTSPALLPRHGTSIFHPPRGH
jgi:hypothetical protein